MADGRGARSRFLGGGGGGKGMARRLKRRAELEAIGRSRYPSPETKLVVWFSDPSADRLQHCDVAGCAALIRLRRPSQSY